MPAKIIFITGTDTGVGKTLLTGLLLTHLREAGVRALALKPFCSGSQNDIQLLHALQGRDLPKEEISPFYFSQPLAPFAAGRLQRREISLACALDSIQAVRDRCDCLLVEGIGGLLVPLGPWSMQSRKSETRNPKSDPLRRRDSAAGTNSKQSKVRNARAEDREISLPEARNWNYCSANPPGTSRQYRTTARTYTVVDWVANMDCQTIVVSRNQLGTINHTLLTVAALLRVTGSGLGVNSAQPTRSSAEGKKGDRLHLLIPKVVLMNSGRPDFSCSTNPRVLAELLAPVPLHSLPFLGGNCNRSGIIKVKARELKHALARILAW